MVKGLLVIEYHIDTFVNKTIKWTCVVLPEHNNLVITVHRGQILIFEDKNILDYVEVVREVQVEEEVVALAKALLRAQNELATKQDAIEKILAPN